MKQKLQTNFDSILNPNPEILFQKTMSLIEKEIQHNKLSKCIQIEGEGYKLIRKFSKHKKIASDLFKKGAQLYLIVAESSYFLLQNQEENIILIPQRLQLELQNKLLQELGQQNIVNEECYQHDIEKDFRNGDQYENIQQQQKDENPILMKEKQECYKVNDYSLLEEIVKKYLILNQFDTQNKQLINFKFYINDEFEIVIEYKINDKNLSLKQSIKRRYLRIMIESVKSYFVDYQLDQLVKNLLLNIFQYEEINLYWQKQIIYNITENKKVKIVGCKYQEFRPNPRQKILIINPKTINSQKRFLEYKILIIRHICQIYFVNHESILMNIMYFRNPSNIHKYSDLVDKSIKRFENFKLLPQKEFMEQQLDNEILKYKELIIELSNINFINEKIEYYKQQIQNIIINDNVTTITEEIEKYQKQQQINELEQNIQNQLDMKQEYENICQRQLLLLNKFKPYKYQSDIQQLNRIHQTLQIERIRVETGLPIYINKKKICQMINQNQVTLLIGETGSGKSTQLIQYIAEELLIDRKVLCVQPRALAARTLAKRVAEEQLSNLGEYVGYNLGVDKKFYNGTKMIFTQDRILLNMLLIDNYLSDYDVVIIDEAHERTMNTDLLLGLLKRLLKERKDLKLIITSATLDEQLYCNYFNCPSLKISGRLYPVQIKYYPYQDYINGVIDILIKKVISKINHGQYINNHVLVFLAGIDEINYVYNKLEEYSNDKIRILSLHGQMGYDEQYEVFRETPQMTKIILSTRIAETSLTIKDVDIVIDIGVDRFQIFDQARNMQVTKLSWISQAQAKQRQGRAGRTLPGKCYRLYDEECFRTMQEHKVPEIQNCNLDLVVLRIKSFNIRIEQFEFLQAPKLEDLQQSEKYLVQIKVLKQLDDTTEITSIGGLMAQIQTEPKMSRILIEAYYRDIFWEVLSIISVMINNINLYSRDQNVGKRLCLIDGSGDLITFFNIYSLFQQQQRNPYIRKEWCMNYGLNYKALRMAESTFKDIESTFWYFEKELRENVSIYAPQVLLIHKFDGYNIKDNILKCFCSAYYPDICVYNGHQLIGYTMIKNNQSLRIYGTSSLSILNTFPQIIICADLYSSAFDFCRIAQEIPQYFVKALPNEFQDKINSYINNQITYKCTCLQDIPSSLVNGLSHKYKNIYEQNKFIQFKYSENNTFTLWSEKEIDLDQDVVDYKYNSQRQVFAKFYGEKMMVYFKHGAQVGDIILNMAEDHGQINFNDVPFNIDVLRTILEANCIQFQTIFETNVTQIGYCGQIHLQSFVEAQKCVDLLNQICIRTIQESEDEFAQKYNHIFERRNQFFQLKHRTFKNKQIQYMAKLTFYSCQNSGHGYITFETQKDAESFFFQSLDILHLDQFLVQCEIKSQVEIRISNIPKEYDEEYFEKKIRDYCQSIQINSPIKYKLLIKNQNQQVEISEEELKQQVLKLCQQQLNQQPNILIQSDKRNYKFTATLIRLVDPQLLEKMRKKVHYSTGILGACRCYMNIEYKIYKQLSKSTCNQIKPIYEKLVHKISEKYHNSVKVIQRQGEGQINNIVVIGKNPNNTRGAAIILHGIIQGYPIRNRTIKNSLIKQLAYQFQKEVEEIEKEFNCVINDMEIIKKGRFLIHSEENNAMKIEEAIQKRILNRIKVESTLNLKKYSFKKLLRTENNILDKLSAKFKILCDFDLAKKMVIFYGNKEETEKCKLELINELEEYQNNAECVICQGEFCDKFILSSCFHQFCKSCIVAYIISSDIFPIMCPKDCNEQISLKDLQQVLSGPEFEKLLDKSFNIFRKSNRAIDEYIDCITPDCDELFKKGNQFYYCDNCLFNFCIKCKQEAHENKTCEEFEKFKKISNDLTDEQLKELGIKKCQKCKQGIQKSQGCNHMHCTQCGSHMCWICGTMANDGQIIYDHIKQKHNNKLFDNDANEQQELQQIEQQNQ